MSSSPPQAFSAIPPRQRAQPGRAPSGRRSGRSGWSALVVGLLAGLVTVVIGGASVLGQAKTYSATATLLVLPQPAGTNESIASLYDALSQGQVVESFQAVMSSSGFQRSALGSSATSTSVTVVPSTSLIDVTSKAGTAAAAERDADAVANRAVKQLSETFKPYGITLVSSASGTGKTSGTSKSALLGIVALLALIVGIAGQQAARYVQGLRSGERRRGTLTSLK